MKIVVTGGPGGGKTTALDFFQREFRQLARVVPESATALFKAGIQRSSEYHMVTRIQRAIYHQQVTMERNFSEVYPQEILVCDRGTLDGLAYWPGSREEFFESVHSSLEKELSRYQAVIFFETAAVSTSNFSTNNPYRIENQIEAIKLDKKLQEIWSQHPHFSFIPTSESFLKKIALGVEKIKDLLDKKPHSA